MKQNFTKQANRCFFNENFPLSMTDVASSTFLLFPSRVFDTFGTLFWFKNLSGLITRSASTSSGRNWTVSNH